MNTGLEMSNEPVALRLGLTLLHSLWQGALVGVGFGLCRIALKKYSSNVRYLAGCFALLLLVAAPVLTFLRGTAAISRTEVSVPRLLSDGDSRFTASDEASIFHFAGGTESVMRGGTALLARAAPWIVAAWLAGVAFFSLRLMRSCWWVRTIRTTANEPVEEKFVRLLNQLRQRLGVSQPVRLLKSTLVEVPTVVGWLRPVILMPVATLAGLTPRQLEAVLAHELAHVRRLDYVVNASQCVVETLMFYHPVIWWISRVVREEREHCCDDLVISVCGDRLAYARALATLEVSRSGLSQFAFAATGGTLANRIRRLFGMPANEAGVTGGTRVGGLALLGIGVVFIIVGACLMAMPKTYRATARIKIEREVSRQNDGKETDSNNDPYFIQTELEVIQSELVLRRVVDALDLAATWGEKYDSGTPLSPTAVIGILRHRVELRPVRNTKLIQIESYSDDSAEAAKLANGIADAYRDYRLEEARQRTLAAINTLGDQYSRQDEKVRKAQEELAALRTELGVNDLDADGSVRTRTVDSDTLRLLEASRVETQTDLAKERTTLEQLRKLGREDLINVLPTTVPDTVLTSLLGQKNQLSIRLADLRNQYSESHPDYRGVKAQLDTADQKIEERVRGIMLSLQTRVKTLEARLDQLSASIDEARARAKKKADETRPYYEKKQKLDEMMRFRQVLALKVESEGMDASSARPAPVSIVDRAMPPRDPVSPNRTLAGTLIAFGLLLDTAGLLIISSGRRANSVQRT